LDHLFLMSFQAFPFWCRGVKVPGRVREQITAFTLLFTPVIVPE